MLLPIEPLNRPPVGQVSVPGSKSHTNRALICAALAPGVSNLTGVLFADDTRAMLRCLADLGVGVVADEDECTVTVTGCAGRPLADGVVLDAGQSGTTSRFLLPLLTLASGSNVLDGAEQLRARPFDDLASSLVDVGARLEGTSLPISVVGGSLAGGSVSIAGAISSQFLSGLLLSAPCADDDVVIHVVDELVSKPYIDLTLSTMAAFGVEVINDDYRRFVVPAGSYRAADLAIEPDASAASYMFAAAAITGGTIEVPGLGTSTIQGDLRFVDALAAMGAEVRSTVSSTTVTGPSQLRGIDIDMSDISDTAQTFAAVATFAASASSVDGIGFIRHKETDRIHAVCHELSRLGVRAVERDDGFEITPGSVTPGVVETYDDHRMAMSFSLIGLKQPGIVISEPACVRKTFPNYFEVLESLRDLGAPTP